MINLGADPMRDVDTRDGDGSPTSRGERKERIFAGAKYVRGFQGRYSLTDLNDATINAIVPMPEPLPPAGVADPECLIEGG